MNRTHVNSLEGCYATTTPTMLRRCTIEEMNLGTFKFGFFLTHFLSVTSRKNQNNSLRSGVNFSLTRPICSHSSKADVVSGLLLLKVNGNSKNHKNLLFHEYFVPLTHTIVMSNAQSFPEIKYSFTALLSLCIVRESNPCQQLGKLLCYHYTNDPAKVYDRRDEFQNFQTWIFPYTFSKCHSKKKPKKFSEKRSKFFANQTNLFSLIESCRFWFVTSQGQWEFKKRQEFTIS